MSIQSVGASSAPYTPPLQGTGTPSGTNAARQAEPLLPTAESQAAKVAQGAQGTGVPPSSEQLNQAVKQIQDVIKQTAQSLQFSIDKDSGMTVVKVVDTESKKVIRQIPSEEVMAIAKALDKLQGLLVKQQA